MKAKYLVLLAPECQVHFTPRVGIARKLKLILLALARSVASHKLIATVRRSV